MGFYKPLLLTVPVKDLAHIVCFIQTLLRCQQPHIVCCFLNIYWGWHLNLCRNEYFVDVIFAWLFLSIPKTIAFVAMSVSIICVFLVSFTMCILSACLRFNIERGSTVILICFSCHLKSEEVTRKIQINEYAQFRLTINQITVKASVLSQCLDF